jgi:hypothetical protein
VSLIDVGGYTRDTKLYVNKEKILTKSEEAFYNILLETFREEGQ